MKAASACCATSLMLNAKQIRAAGGVGERAFPLLSKRNLLLFIIQLPLRSRRHHWNTWNLKLIYVLPIVHCQKLPKEVLSDSFVMCIIWGNAFWQLTLKGALYFPILEIEGNAWHSDNFPNSAILNAWGCVGAICQNSLQEKKLKDPFALWQVTCAARQETTVQFLVSYSVYCKGLGVLSTHTHLSMACS